MKCDYVDRVVVLALVFTLIGDILALGSELLSQRCAEKEELVQRKEKSDLNKKLDNLERRISNLENS